MKPVGHLRYAWIALQDARKHIGAIEDGVPSVALLLAAVSAKLRPVLEAAESKTHNDNGETPLEWAVECRAALGRFVHCFRELGKQYPDKPIPEECIAELETWGPMFDVLVSRLVLLEAKEKKT